jgi:hypothetical protein
MFGCSDVYHWMGFGTYLQHGQSPPAWTSRTAAVDTRTYHGSNVTRSSTHGLRLLLSPTVGFNNPFPLPIQHGARCTTHH